MSAPGNRRRKDFVRRSASQACGFILTLAVPLIAQAGFCDTRWNVEKIVNTFSGHPPHFQPLRDSQQRGRDVSLEQIRVFSEAKERISRAAGISPNFIICDEPSENAFATRTQNGDLVGVTVGMLRMVDGDPDMAAAVLGHEVAHRTKQHSENAVATNAVIGIAAILIGALADARSQRRTGIATGIGVNIGQIGGTLLTRKFSRDQEREADELGFSYLVAAGFNPVGAVRLAEKMNQRGGGAGLFFDSHPGWPERRELFQGMIASNPQAQQLVARYGQSSSGLSTAMGETTSGPNMSSSGQAGYTQALSNSPTIATSSRSSLKAYTPLGQLVSDPNLPDPPPKRGKFEYGAEKAAASTGCPTEKPASLTESGPGFEVFNVICLSSETVAVRCDFGNCKVLK